MANRFPIIGNSVAKRLEELPAGDNLDLSQSGIYDGIGTGSSGQVLYSSGTGISWSDLPSEIDTTYTLSAVDGDTSLEKVIRLTDVNLVTNDVVLIAGSNVSLTRNNNEITINSSYVDTDTITRIKGGSAGTFVTGDVLLSPTGSLFISQVGNTITLGATDTNTITRLRGTTSGTYLTGDITLTSSGASTVSQVGSAIDISSVDTITRLKGGSTGSFLTGDVTLVGAGAATVSQTNQTITVNAPNTTYGLNVVDTSTTTKTVALAGSDNTTVNVNFVSGDGVSLTVDNNNITFNADTAEIDISDLNDVSVSQIVDTQILKYSNTSSSWVNAYVDYSEVTNTPALATVATSGSYNDLSDTPTLATVATSGSYNDLNDLPTLVTDAADLTDTTGRFFSGDYADLSNAPVLAAVATSGSYSDLLNAPVLADVATSGSYTDLSDTPTIPPERQYNISSVTDVTGAVLRLNESVSNTNDNVLLQSGTGITVSQVDDNTISISSTLVGLPEGLTATESSLVFEGSTTDGNRTTLQIANPSANRTITFPNRTGTIVLDSTNKTYTIDANDTDSNFYETKLGLLGTNSATDSYTTLAGTGGLKVDIESVVGATSTSAYKNITITPPPTVHIGTTPPIWAKDGDLWLDQTTNTVKIFNESLYPQADSIVDYFQSVDSGDSRFFTDKPPSEGLLSIPNENQFIVGYGIPTGAFVTSRFDPTTGTECGWFNLNTPVTTNIPHNAKLRVYNTNPNISISSLWVEITTSGSGGGLSELITDTSPQLGGNLDLNGNNINGIGNISCSGFSSTSTGIILGSSAGTYDISFSQNTGVGPVIRNSVFGDTGLQILGAYNGGGSYLQDVHLGTSGNASRFKNLVPFSTSTYNLGSESIKWNTTHTVNLNTESLKLTTNNQTVLGTTGTAGQIKQIAGAPFWHDGSQWREFFLINTTAVTQTADTDWDNTIFRATFDDDFTDARFGVTPSYSSGASITTAAVKVGTGSLRLQNQYLKYPHRAEYDFTGEWTIEGWFYWDTLPAGNGSDGDCIFSKYNPTFRGSSFMIGAEVVVGGYVNFYWKNNASAHNGSSGTLIAQYGSNDIFQKWNHIAVVREPLDGSIHFYLNGVEHSSTANNNVIDNDIANSADHDLAIGYYQDSSDSRNFDGYVDDFRISTVARYTDTFAPPTTALPVTGSTTTVILPPTNKSGVITLGATPTWRGTSGVTVTQQSSGNYRLTFSSSYANADDYYVMTSVMDTGAANNVFVVTNRTTTHVDFIIKEGSNFIDTADVAIQIINHD